MDGLFSAFEQVYDSGMFGELSGAALAVALASVDPAVLDPDAALGYAVAMRRVASWAAAGEAAGLDRMRRAWVPVDDEAREAQAEVRTAYGCSAPTAGAHLSWAYTLSTLPGTTQALRAGTIDVARARIVSAAACLLTASDATTDPTAQAANVAALETRLLAAHTATTGGMTLARWRRLAARTALVLDPTAAQRRRCAVTLDRQVWHHPGDQPDCQGVLGLRGPVEATAACEATIDALARARRADARRTGEPATLAGLRFDVAVELLTGTHHHHTQPDPCNPDTCTTNTDDPDPGDTDPDSHDPYPGHPDSHHWEANHPDGHDPHAGHPDSHDPHAGHPDSHDWDAGHSDVFDPAAAEDAQRCAAVVQQPAAPDTTGTTDADDRCTGPAATTPAGGCCGGGGRWWGGLLGLPVLSVTVPLSTLLGIDDAPAELAGLGAVPAELAREVAALAPVWHRLLTDPVDAHLVVQDVKTYRPTAAQRRFLLARDPHCQSRGCTARRGLQHDHVTPHPTGATSVTNLVALCPACHNLKTHRTWHHHLDPDTATLTQTSPLGRSYRTTPDPPPAPTGVHADPHHCPPTHRPAGHAAVPPAPLIEPPEDPPPDHPDDLPPPDRHHQAVRDNAPLPHDVNPRLWAAVLAEQRAWLKTLDPSDFADIDGLDHLHDDIDPLECSGEVVLASGRCYR